MRLCGPWPRFQLESTAARSWGKSELASGHQRELRGLCLLCRHWLERRQLRVHWHAVIGARPARSRREEDAGLRPNGCGDVKRPGRYQDDIGVLGLTWHSASTRCAEAVSESLGLRNLECADLLFATEPLQCSRLNKHVRGVPGAGHFAATGAVAVIEALWLASHLISHGAT